MDKIELRICKTQRKIFEYAICQGYSLKNFTELYLNSLFCEECFDVIYSRFQMETPVECMDFILEEFGDKLIKEKSDVGTAGYVGYIYRYMYFSRNMKSKELIKIIPYSVVLKYYNLFEIEDTEYIVDQIFKELDN